MISKWDKSQASVAEKELQYWFSYPRVSTDHKAAIITRGVGFATNCYVDVCFY